MWCWHHIKDNLNGLCPACRSPYSDDPHAFSAVDRKDVIRSEKQKQRRAKGVAAAAAAAAASGTTVPSVSNAAAIALAAANGNHNGNAALGMNGQHQSGFSGIVGGGSSGNTTANNTLLNASNYPLPARPAVNRRDLHHMRVIQVVHYIYNSFMTL
jgi:RING/Ubox like zinc-binding domain